jgi:hypothetical protein
MTARTLFELGALSALVAMTRGALWQCPAEFGRLYPFGLAATAGRAGFAPEIGHGQLSTEVGNLRWMCDSPG